MANGIFGFALLSVICTLLSVLLFPLPRHRLRRCHSLSGEGYLICSVLCYLFSVLCYLFSVLCSLCSVLCILKQALKHASRLVCGCYFLLLEV